MGDERGGGAGDGPDQPPSPEGVSTLDELAARLRDVRAWAGNPSFTRLAKEVVTIRSARGLPDDERPGRVTVYECFRSGRRRIDVELLVDIVTALGVDQAGQKAWRRAHRITALRSARPSASARTVHAVLGALEGEGRRAIANLVGPAGTGRSAVLAALPVDAVRVDLATDDASLLHEVLDDSRGLVVIDNADSPAALAAVSTTLDRNRHVRAVVASCQPLPGWPGTPASLLPEIVVVPAVEPASGTPAVDHPSLTPRPPAELPPDISEFTGRDRESTTLAEVLGAPGEARAVAVRVITGMGGIGKTALAVHVAHHLVPRYPDGQLFAELTDAQPEEVLVQFLVGLGVDRSVVPDGLTERVAMYRSRTAGRRVLVVLDNAPTESVVRPLIPGTPSCGVIVTSRRRLSALSGAERMDLEQLSEAEALALLRKVTGADVREWDADAAHTVVDLCDRLPLAIKIAGARLAHRRDVRLARFAERLADEKSRLDILATGDIGIRACFDLTYADLGEPARRAFLFGGLLSLDTVASWVLAVATGQSHTDVDLAVDELVGTRLFTAVGTDLTDEPRFGMHDLVRLYAAERAAADLTDDERQSGIQKVLEAFLALALEANRAVPYRTLPDPDPDDRPALPTTTAALLADPLAWFESEKDQLRAIVVFAAKSGRPDLAWRIADACAGYYEARDHYDDWRETHLACLDHPELTGLGAFTMTRNLAYQYSLPVVRGTLMTGFAQRALDISEAADLPGRATEARVLIAVASIARGAFDEASELATAAREDAPPGSPVDLAALSVLGILSRLRGDLDTAAEYFSSLLRRVTDRRHTGYELIARRTLGIIWRARGRYAEASEVLSEGIRLARILGVRTNELLMLIELGEVSALAGEPTADEELAAAVRLAENMSSDIGVALAWRAMSTADIARGDLNMALERLHRSLAVQQRHGLPHVEAHTLRALGGVQARLGDPRAAAGSWHHARGIYLMLGNDTELAAIERDLAALGESRAE
jgi:tetratricopeptide (TPR) repeat protein